MDADGDGPGLPTAVRFVYDGAQVALQFDDAGSLTNRFLWGPHIDQFLADEQVGSQVLWTLTDHLGSVRDVVNASGGVVKHVAYDSFGNIVADTNPALRLLSGYTGREFETEIGLQYNRARWYDPRTGQFVAVDPIRDGLNWYSYVSNRPLTRTDPSGLFADPRRVQAPAGPPAAEAISAMVELAYQQWALNEAAAGNVQDFQRGPGEYSRMVVPLAPSRKADIICKDAPNPAMAGWLNNMTAMLGTQPPPSTRTEPIAINIMLSTASNALLRDRWNLQWQRRRLDANYEMMYNLPLVGTDMRLLDMADDAQSNGWGHALATEGPGLALSAGGDFALGLGAYARLAGAPCPKGGTGGAAKLAGGMGQDSAPMRLERLLQAGERIEELKTELKRLTFATGNEHSIVSFRDGGRGLVSGGPGGIELPVDKVKRVLVHTHPYQLPPTGPSEFDRAALRLLGKNPARGQVQRHSYLLEHGVLQRFEAK